MKYYNNELETNKQNPQEKKILIELLGDVKKSINKSLEQIILLKFYIGNLKLNKLIKLK